MHEEIRALLKRRFMSNLQVVLQSRCHKKYYQTVEIHLVWLHLPFLKDFPSSFLLDQVGLCTARVMYMSVFALFTAILTQLPVTWRTCIEKWKTWCEKHVPLVRTCNITENVCDIILSRSWNQRLCVIRYANYPYYNAIFAKCLNITLKLY